MNAIPFPKTYISPPRRVRTRVVVRVVIAGILALFIVGYFFYQAKGFIFGPRLSVSTPKDGETFASGVVRIAGNATPDAAVSVNGARVDSDGKGEFSEELILAPGVHELHIMAADRFGKNKEETRQINVE